jgi:prepilin-type N-terminal cleavage/methylation domain-containing protein
MMRRESAFTLVEILIALAIITLLVAMTAFMLGSVQQDARVQRTRVMINRINQALLPQYESFRERPISLDNYTLASTTGLPIGTPVNPTPNINEAKSSWKFQAVEAARMRLSIRRDLMRLELPDRIGDLFNVAPGAGPNPGTIIPGTQLANGPVIQTGVVTARGQTYPFATSDNKTQIYINFASLAPPTPARTVNYWSLATANWNTSFQSSECLRMILLSTPSGAGSGMDQVRATDVADTDSDGMQEILDAWQRPIEWLRWPAGYQDPNPQFSAVALSATTERYDPMDMLEADWGFFGAGPLTANDPSVAFPMPIPKPYALRPLVISGGQDRRMNVLFEISSAPIQYHQLFWDTTYTDSLHGAIADYKFIDPWLRVPSGYVGAIPGSVLDPSPEARATERDNITSFNLNP